MKQNCKRIFSLLLCAALVCTLFAGCGGRNKQLDIIYPITGNITSFDPQVAATQDEYLIAENCYEGWCVWRTTARSNRLWLWTGQ